jgi:hypothetical protein
MKEEIDLNLVLVRQVSALVRETANILCDSPEPSEVLLVEAHLYRLLAVNCEEKARMAEELGRSWGGGPLDYAQEPVLGLLTNVEIARG